MAYNNVPFHRADSILSGRESIPVPKYDRYSNPTNWPTILYSEKIKKTNKKQKEDRRKEEEGKLLARGDTRAGIEWSMQEGTMSHCYG